MTDILFGQSYYLRFDPKLWDAMQPYPPLGTLYAASYLRRRGYQVGLFDAMLAESEAEWDRALEQQQPRLAVLYEDNFNYLSKMCLLRMRQAACRMIEMARRHECTVIVAGSDASDHAEFYLSKGADYVLLGEGEVTLGELVDHIFEKSNQSLSEILGLAYVRAKNQGNVRNSRRPDLRQLDDLPFPAWDLVDVERYRSIWKNRHGYFSMNMATTRGCPYHCNWCAKPIWGQRYNARSPENVAAELKWLIDNYDPDHIWFVDDIFGLRPGWVAQFAQAVEASSARTPFKSLNRADLLQRDGEIEALRQAGCQMVWIGAESGSQKILDAMDKGTRVEQIYAAAQKLHAAGIQVGFFLQFGYPGETRADIARTFQMVRECRPDDIGASISYPLPGTPFFEMVKAELGSRRNWIDSNDLAMLYQGPFSTAFYRQLHSLLHREFRARRYWHAMLHGGDGPRLRQMLRWLLQIARWPYERLRLEYLAHQPHRPVPPLPMRMSPEEAAHPSGEQL